MLIELTDIEKFYKTGAGQTFVLRNINLEVEEGEFVSIMGPSGSGKSTLLHILGALDDPSDGSYLLDGNEVVGLPEKKRSELHKGMISFIFQAYHLIDELTVYENIETPLLYRSIKRAERGGMVSDILDRFNIVGKKDLFPAQLSGGQQQVVGVARALVSAPRLLLADEPTGNLSSKEGEIIMGLFKELHEAGTTIVQATHSESNAAYADRIIHLADGWLDKTADQNL